MKKFVILIIVIAISVFTSCSTTKAMPVEILTTTTWQLAEINGNGINVDSYKRGIPSITFTTDNKVTGNSGCNNFSGSYNLNDVGGMTISRVIATKMFCDGVNESEFFNALDKVTMSKTTKDKLTLMNGVEEVIVFVPKQ